MISDKSGRIEADAAGLELGGGERPPNPFPVYPVSSLEKLESDILDATVQTHAVCAVTARVEAYNEGRSGNAADMAAAPVFSAIRGDFGTGKTHLLRYAQALLVKTRPQDRPIVLAVAGTEANFAVWYVQAVGARLPDLGLPALGLELLAKAAIEVGNRTELTASLARAIADDFNEVYPALRNGQLSPTDIERRFCGWIDEVTPNGTAELRRALAALPWQETRDLAVRWLAGLTLQPAEKKRLRIERDIDPEAEAAAVIVAVAGLCRLCGRGFALLLDELEHLIADDRHTGTRLNTTWVKRLLEDLAAEKAFVCIAGHWSAWDQQLQDFRDRFGGNAPIDLAALTQRDACELVHRFAPEWSKRLLPETFPSLIDAAHGNVRLVLTILHQVYADATTDDTCIGPDAIAGSAGKRLRIAASTPSKSTVLKLLTDTATAAGATISHHEQLFGEVYFDLIARIGDEVRMVADVRYATTQLDLARTTDDFATAFSAARRRHPAAQGVLLVSGAVDPEPLALLTDLPGVHAMSLDDVRIKTRLIAVLKAILDKKQSLRNHEKTSTKSDVELRRNISERVVAAAHAENATKERIEEAEFGSSTRSSSIVADTISIFNDKSADVRKSVIQSILSDGMLPRNMSLFNITAIVLVLLSFLFLTLFYIAVVDKSYNRLPFYGTSLLLTSFFATALMLARYLVKERHAFNRYRRWSFQILEEMYVRGAPEKDMISARNIIADVPEGGYTDAVKYATARLSDRFGDDFSGYIRM